MREDVARDWQYSNRFLEHAQEIAGRALIVAAPLKIDQEENADLIMLRYEGRGDVAFRARRPEYQVQYPYDITFRSARVSGQPTEIDKVVDGKGFWFLYGFGSPVGDRLCAWTLLDLNRFRSALFRGLIAPTNRNKPNADGTFFDVYDIRLINASAPGVIAATEPAIPEMALPAPKPKPVSKRDFFQDAIKFPGGIKL